MTSSPNAPPSTRTAWLAAAAAIVAVAAACATAEEAPRLGVTATEPDPGADPEPVVAVAPPDASQPPSTKDGGPASSCPSPCGLAPQCGCLATETCDLDLDGDRECVKAGSTPAGAACLSTSNCAPGLVCAAGVCRATCATPGTACTADRSGACGSYPKSTTDAGPPVTYSACAVTCAYDKEGSCGFKPGDAFAAACVYVAATNTVECARVRNVQLQSGVCTADAECGAARVCVPQSGYSSCRKLCKVGDPYACGGCTALTPARVVAGVTYGYCP